MKTTLQKLRAAADQAAQTFEATEHASDEVFAQAEAAYIQAQEAYEDELIRQNSCSTQQSV